MNQEQRQIQLEKLNKLEGLLAYVVKTGEMGEETLRLITTIEIFAAVIC